ncbi:hypothetical protein TYRP_016576 [Tyrophagus putrescentiae]|nr:hypothetical protein TYRP_016576 [Tyrophagus putrescentiae]
MLSTLSQSAFTRHLLLPSLLSLGLSRVFHFTNSTMAEADSGRCQPLLTSQFVVGYITIKDSTSAEELATKLVNERLVACVNILPAIRSIYRWEGKVENDGESLMVVKTSAAKSDDVIAFVKANHPYDVPEVIFTPILAGNPDYLKWLGESVRPADGGDGK